MTRQVHHARLIVQKSPCTACVIVNHLNMETLQKIAASRSDFTWEIVEIGHPREVWQIEGFEVEKLPAILIDDEQISAGNIISPRQLAKFLDKL